MNSSGGVGGGGRYRRGVTHATRVAHETSPSIAFDPRRRSTRRSESDTSRAHVLRIVAVARNMSVAARGAWQESRGTCAGSAAIVRADEVDESALDVDARELHAHAIADVQAVVPAHHAPF